MPEANDAHHGKANYGSAGLKQKITQIGIAVGNERLSPFEDTSGSYEESP
jgi:hypothetical protein